MPKPDATNVPAAFRPHLQPGEQLRYFMYGVKQPNLLLIFLLLAFGIFPGIIAIAIMTKHFLVGLTDKRFLVLQVKNMTNHEVKSVLEYSLEGLGQMKVAASTGMIFTNIKIDDPQKPFVAKFHRAGMKTNREHGMAIEAALTGRQLAA